MTPCPALFIFCEASLSKYLPSSLPFYLPDISLRLFSLLIPIRFFRSPSLTFTPFKPILNLPSLPFPTPPFLPTLPLLFTHSKPILHLPSLSSSSLPFLTIFPSSALPPNSSCTYQFLSSSYPSFPSPRLLISCSSKPIVHLSSHFSSSIPILTTTPLILGPSKLILHLPSHFPSSLPFLPTHLLIFCPS